MKYSRLIVFSILLFSLIYVNQSANGAAPLRRTASFLKTRVFQRRANVRSRRFLAQCEIQEAEKACRVKTLLDQGVSLCKQGKSDDVLDMFNEAIRLDPANAEAYALRGSWHYHYDDYENAVSDCNKAIDLNPESSLAFSVRGAAYIGKCEYVKSLNDLTEAIRLDPKCAGIYSNRAKVYYVQKNYDKAIHDLTDAIRLEPKDSSHYIHRANCYANNRQYAEAVADFDTIVNLAPDNPLYYEYRGALLVYQGDYDRATADFQTMLRLNPDDPAASFSITPKRELDEKDLEHGKEQVRRMLADRPAMASHGKKAEWLYDWAARMFAGECLGERIYWNPEKPTGDFFADHQSPDEETPGFIRIHNASQKHWIPSFERLWAAAVFELFNINGVKDFKLIKSKVLNKTISREEYITAYLIVESHAAEMARAFYIRMLFPWANEHNIATDSTVWHLAERKTLGSNLISSYIETKNSRHHLYYGNRYDMISIQSYILQGQYAEAMSIINQKIGQTPDATEKSRLFCYRGYLHAMTENLFKARDDLNESIQLEPTYGHAYATRASVHARLNEHEKAISDYKEATRLTPAFIDKVKPRLLHSYKILGRKYVGEYEWNQALIIYSEAIRLAPDDSDLYCSRGVVYHEICNCTKAITDLNEAIRLNSKSYYAFANRGRVFLSTGEPEKALDDLREALRINLAKLDDISDDIISAYMKCASIQEKKCNWDLVIDYLTELRRLELMPSEKQLISYRHIDDSKAKRKNKTGIPAAAKWDTSNSKLFSSPPKSISIEYKEAGSIRYLSMNDKKPSIDLSCKYFSMDDKKSSIDVSSKSNNRNDKIIPRLTNAYKNRSVQHADNQRWDQAIADLNEVLTLAPKQSNVLMDRAVLYHRKGDHAKAVSEMTEIIKTERYPHDAYLNRGTVYFNIGELDKAIADYSEVIHLYQGSTPLTYYRRAETYLTKGDCESALADANAAIKLDSTYAEAYECRGRIHEKLGDKVQAAEDFQKAKSLLEQDAETAETHPVAPAN